MVCLLNPYDLSLQEFQEKLRFADRLDDSILITKKNIEPDSITSINEILDTSKLIWISSSGSYNKKLIGLSSKALLSSAHSVNEWLSVSASDSWAIALPLQHIASVSIIFRSLLSECKVELFAESWKSAKFCEFLAAHKITLCSLVPTQLYDLVKNKLKPPPSLRSAIVGGARLDETIYLESRKLGWPVLPSYGLTECASQVACAAPESLGDKNQMPAMIVLPHLEATAGDDGRIRISGSSLLSMSVILDQSGSPAVNDYRNQKLFITSDLGSVSDREIKLYGRADRSVKVKGSFIQIQSYEDIGFKFISSLGQKEHGLLIACAIRDSREDHKIVLCSYGYNLSLSPEEMKEGLNNYIKQHNPELPAVNNFFELKDLPLLENQKINYNSLNQIAEQLSLKNINGQE